MQLSIERNLPEDLAAISFERGAKIVNIDAAQLGHQPVGAARRNAPQPEIVDPILAPSADDVVALGNFLEEYRNVGRIMLQVAIHGDNVLAAGVVESSGQSGRLPKIAAQLHDGHSAIDGGNLAQQRKRAVDGTVIDQHHLKRLSARLHHGLEPRVEVGDVLLLVVEGHYDGIFEHSTFNYTAAGRKNRSASCGADTPVRRL